MSCVVFGVFLGHIRSEFRPIGRASRFDFLGFFLGEFRNFSGLRFFLLLPFQLRLVLPPLLRRIRRRRRWHQLPLLLVFLRVWPRRNRKRVRRPDLRSVQGHCGQLQHRFQPSLVTVRRLRCRRRMLLPPRPQILPRVLLRTSAPASARSQRAIRRRTGEERAAARRGGGRIPGCARSNFLDGCLLRIACFVLNEGSRCGRNCRLAAVLGQRFTRKNDLSSVTLSGKGPGCAALPDADCRNCAAVRRDCHIRGLATLR